MDNVKIVLDLLFQIALQEKAKRMSDRGRSLTPRALEIWLRRDRLDAMMAVITDMGRETAAYKNQPHLRSKLAALFLLERWSSGSSARRGRKRKPKPGSGLIGFRNESDAANPPRSRGRPPAMTPHEESLWRACYYGVALGKFAEREHYRQKATISELLPALMENGGIAELDKIPADSVFLSRAMEKFNPPGAPSVQALKKRLQRVRRKYGPFIPPDIKSGG